MKKSIAIISVVILFVSLTASAQPKEEKKKFTFTKVSRDTKKEAKKYEKENWRVMPGTLSMEQQLNDSFKMQVMTDDKGLPQWIVASGSSVAQTQAAAQMQAMEVAKITLVSLLETNMKSVVESDVSNNQINAIDAASITKTIQVSANRVSKKLGYIQPMLNISRSVGNNTEVKVLIGYNYEIAKQYILNEMKAELQLETDDVRKRYEKFLNPENFNRGKIENTNDK
jgi:hypothetical protein